MSEEKPAKPGPGLLVTGVIALVALIGLVALVAAGHREAWLGIVVVTVGFLRIAQVWLTRR